MANYDPAIIATMADTLYARAEALVWEFASKYAFIGALIGGGAGYALALNARGESGGPVMLGVLMLGTFFGYVGHGVGRAKSFALRFEAQQLLVMLEIERNTRGTRD